MPLSTSSSEVDYREVPAGHHWFGDLAIALPLVLVALVGWEWLARQMHHEPGTYKDSEFAGGMWADEREKLDQPDHGIRLIILGSSRILYATDLDILESSFGTRPLQLAISGTSPSRFVEDIVNNTDFDGLLLVGATPFLFNNLEAGPYGGNALKHYQEFSASRRIGFLIHHWLENYFAFLDDGFGLFNLIDHHVVLPNREGALRANANGWKLSNHYADRQTDMWAPAEIEGSFDNQQVKNFWIAGFERRARERARGQPLDVEAMRDRTVEFYKPLIGKLRDRGGDLIIIRMPGRSVYEEFAEAAGHRKVIWDPMVKALDVFAINTMDYPELSTDLEIPEWSHLSRASQDDWSRRIKGVIEAEYEKERGRSVGEVLNH
jgi:hypothetical protein